MLVDLSCKVEILVYLCFFPVFFYFHDGTLYISIIVSLIYFECFLFHTFCRISPIAFRRFFYTVHIGILSATDPYFLEIVAPFVIVEIVNGEDLLTLNGCESKNGGNLVIAILKFGLIK